MILRLDPNGVPQIDELEDFRRLHCEFASDAVQLDNLGRSLAGVAEVVYPATVWIELDWMRQQGVNTDPAWLQKFDQMIAGAKSHGWVSADGKRVKAHAIWTANHSNRT
ncbi:hypothetical protein [Variovorax paradoxus]|uniref:hypothetical protein n=1 Tax=Variovorax paradoxus TaxID=34073 RepID=UPI003ECFC592